MVHQAKMGKPDKKKAFQKLGKMTEVLEKGFSPHQASKEAFDSLLKEQKKQAQTWDKPEAKENLSQTRAINYPYFEPRETNLNAPLLKKVGLFIF